MAKARKKTSARAASAKKKKKTGAKKKSGARKKARASNVVNLTALKKQLRDHMKQLSASKSADPSVGQALASLQRAHEDLASICGSTMVIPLA